MTIQATTVILITQIFAFRFFLLQFVLFRLRVEIFSPCAYRIRFPCNCLEWIVLLRDYRDVSNSRWVDVYFFLSSNSMAERFSFMYQPCAYNVVLFCPNLGFNKSGRRTRMYY